MFYPHHAGAGASPASKTNVAFPGWRCLASGGALLSLATVARPAFEYRMIGLIARGRAQCAMRTGGRCGMRDRRSRDVARLRVVDQVLQRCFAVDVQPCRQSEMTEE